MSYGLSRKASKTYWRRAIPCEEDSVYERKTVEDFLEEAYPEIG